MLSVVFGLLTNWKSTISKTKRLEKEIDYLKGLIGILVFLIAGLVAWFVNTDDETNIYFKLIAIVLFSFFCFRYN